MTSLYNLGLAGLYIFGACGATLGIYFIARRLLSGYVSDQTETLAGSVIFRVAALHSLVLALVFAQEQINYSNVRKLTIIEAGAVADVYYDLDRYNANVSSALRSAMRDYVQTVRLIEWDNLAEGSLSSEAWDKWNRVYLGVLDLVPETPRQVALRQSMLADLDQISNNRTQRSVGALGTVTNLFWYAAIAGFLLVVFPYFTFAPTALHLALLSVFAAFNGLMLFFIVAIGNPYAEPARLEPLAFDRLAADWEVELEKRRNAPPPGTERPEP